MVYKKFLLGILIIILIFSYFFSVPIEDESVKEKLLKSLEDEFQFCEIIKSEGTNFWLICNGRPFFASYYDEKLNYKLNGWSFLEREEVWSELSECEFYKSERANNGIELTFYCRLFSSKPTAKKLLFNLDTLKTNKLGETEFLPLFLDDLKDVYPTLNDCEVKNFSKVNLEIIDVNKINLNCDGVNRIIYTKFDLFIFPTLELESFDSQTKRAKYIFQQIFGDVCSLKSVVEEEGKNHIILNSECDSLPFDINVDYYFPPRTYGYSYHLIPKNGDIETYIINNLLNKFLLNPKQVSQPIFVTSYKDSGYPYDVEVKIYKAGDEVLKFFETEDEVFFIERICDKMRCP